jgi:hypothetical protein
MKMHTKNNTIFWCHKTFFSNSSGHDEIIKDIEMRVSITEWETNKRQTCRGFKDVDEVYLNGTTGRLHYRRWIELKPITTANRRTKNYTAIKKRWWCCFWIRLLFWNAVWIRIALILLVLLDLELEFCLHSLDCNSEGYHIWKTRNDRRTG